MKRVLSLMMAALLCACLTLPTPAARAEEEGASIYTMLMILMQGFSVQPSAAYDVTDLYADNEALNRNETVFAVIVPQNWVLITGVAPSGSYAATVYAYDDMSYILLLQGVAGAYSSLQAMTSRPEEKLVIEVALEDGQTYIFDSPEDAQALLDLLGE